MFLGAEYSDGTIRNKLIIGHRRTDIYLANGINRELRKLRVQRHRFQQGDTELNNAVTNISRDLRTPLTPIFGYLDLLEQSSRHI